MPRNPALSRPLILEADLDDFDVREESERFRLALGEAREWLECGHGPDELRELGSPRLRECLDDPRFERLVQASAKELERREVQEAVLRLLRAGVPRPDIAGRLGADPAVVRGIVRWHDHMVRLRLLPRPRQPAKLRRARPAILRRPSCTAGPRSRERRDAPKRGATRAGPSGDDGEPPPSDPPLAGLPKRIVGSVLGIRLLP